MKITDLPLEIFAKIFQNFSYDEIANLRGVCHYFDENCKEILNSGYQRILKRYAVCAVTIRELLSHSETVSRNQDKDYYLETLEILDVRLYMLAMSYGEYMDLRMICFIPGRILDELNCILESLSAGQPGYDLKNFKIMCTKAIVHFQNNFEDELISQKRELSPSERQRIGAMSTFSYAIREQIKTFKAYNKRILRTTNTSMNYIHRIFNQFRNIDNENKRYSIELKRLRNLNNQHLKLQRNNAKVMKLFTRELKNLRKRTQEAVASDIKVIVDIKNTLDRDIPLGYQRAQIVNVESFNIEYPNVIMLFDEDVASTSTSTSTTTLASECITESESYANVYNNRAIVKPSNRITNSLNARRYKGLRINGVLKNVATNCLIFLNNFIKCDMNFKDDRSVLNSLRTAALPFDGQQIAINKLKSSYLAAMKCIASDNENFRSTGAYYLFALQFFHAVKNGNKTNAVVNVIRALAAEFAKQINYMPIGSIVLSNVNQNEHVPDIITKIMTGLQFIASNFIPKDAEDVKILPEVNQRKRKLYSSATCSALKKFKK